MTQAEVTVTKLPTPTISSVTHRNLSYTVPPTTSTDPFTGKPIENPAYHVENMTLTMTIDNKNIKFNPGSYYYYTIRIKGSFSNEWDPNRTTDIYISEIVKTNPTLTTLIFTSRNNSIKVPPEGQVDFQVKIYEKTNIYWPPSDGWPSSWIETLTAESEWSNIKTINIKQDANNETPNQPNSTPNPTSTNQQPTTILAGLTLREIILAVALYTIVVILIVVLLYKRERPSKGKNYEST